MGMPVGVIVEAGVRVKVGLGVQIALTIAVTVGLEVGIAEEQAATRPTNARTRGSLPHMTSSSALHRASFAHLSPLKHYYLVIGLRVVRQISCFD